MLELNLDKPLTVGMLKEMLAKFPDDAVVYSQVNLDPPYATPAEMVGPMSKFLTSKGIEEFGVDASGLMICAHFNGDYLRKLDKLIDKWRKAKRLS